MTIQTRSDSMKPWGVGVLSEDARIVVNSDGHLLTLFGGRNFVFTDKASAHAIKDALNALPEGAIKLLEKTPS